MLKYNRTDKSEVIDTNKTSDLNGYIILDF